MKSDHPDLREIYQAYASSRRPSGRKRCPSPRAIAKSFETSTSVRTKKRIVDHISECPMCHEEFMMFFEHQKTTVATANVIIDMTVHPDRPSRKARNRVGHSPAWQGALILLGLGLALSSFFFIVRQKERSEMRQAAVAGITLLSPKRGHSLSAPLVFRWQGDSASEYYVLELFDEALLPIWASDRIHGLEVLTPSEISSNLCVGKVYFWMVTSYSGGSKSEESRLSRFTVRR